MSMSPETQRELVKALELVARQLPTSVEDAPYVQGVVDLHGDEIVAIRAALAKARAEMEG